MHIDGDQNFTDFVKERLHNHEESEVRDGRWEKQSEHKPEVVSEAVAGSGFREVDREHRAPLLIKEFVIL